MRRNGKRGSGRVVSIGELRPHDSSFTAFDPPSEEPDPAEAARLADDFEALLQKLRDADLRRCPYVQPVQKSDRQRPDFVGIR